MKSILKNKKTGVIVLVLFCWAAFMPAPSFASEEWIMGATISMVGSRGCGDKFLKLSTSGSYYSAGDVINIIYDASNADINDESLLKDFFAQLLLAYSLGRTINVEVEEASYTNCYNESRSGWVLKTVYLD